MTRLPGDTTRSSTERVRRAALAVALCLVGTTAFARGSAGDEPAHPATSAVDVRPSIETSMPRVPCGAYRVKVVAAGLDEATGQSAVLVGKERRRLAPRCATPDTRWRVSRWSRTAYVNALVKLDRSLEATDIRQRGYAVRIDPVRDRIEVSTDFSAGPVEGPNECGGIPVVYKDGGRLSLL